MLTFYILSGFYWNLLFKKHYTNFKEKIQVLTDIKRVDPYYKGYLILATSSSTGDFIFKTKKKLFEPGQRCLLTFRIKKPKEYLNPFYTEKYRRLRLKGIQNEVILDKNIPPLCSLKSAWTLERIRYKLLEFSEKLPPLSKGLFQALVLGVRYNLPETYIERLKNQGLYHLLAISGFNLAILFGIFYSLAYFLLKHTPLIKTGYPLQNISYLLALPGAFFILLFSGFCPSALRAFAFLSLFVFTKLIFRSTSSIIILFLTAFLILLFQPYLIGNLSFQLSFLATLALILGNRIFNALFSEKFQENSILQKALRFVLYSITCSLMVSFFVAPFILYINGKFPLAIVLNNLFATAFWSLIFIPLSIIIALLSFFNQGLAINLSHLLGALFNLYAKIPFFEVTYKPDVPVNLFLCFWFFEAFLLLCLIVYIKGFYKKLTIFLLITVFLYGALNYFYQKMFYITIFDVGRADAVLIKNKQDYIMIDTGPNYSKDFNWTKVYLEPVLNKLGIDTFKLIIISHPDMDHCGGLNILCRDFEVEDIFSGSFKIKDWKAVNPYCFPSEITAPKAFKINNAELFLFPGKSDYRILNRESLVVYLEYRGLTVLFPGDIDVPRFYRMKKFGEILPLEVLLSPHHGSKSGLNKEVLSWLKPKVILTSGRGRYHPHKEFLKLVKTLKIPHYSTSEKGAIYVFPKRDFFLVCFEKDRREGFWSSVFFPFIPGYIESDNFCKRFTYHRIAY